MFALGCSLFLLSLLPQNAGERDVRARLIGQQLNRMLQCIHGLWQLVLLLVDAAQDGPGIAVLRTQLQRVA